MIPTTLTGSTTVLDPEDADKPLDIGNGLIAATLGLTGQIQSISSMHSSLGYMVLSKDPPFSDQDRFDTDVIRSHRTALSDPTGPGMGLNWGLVWRTTSVELLGRAVPRLHLTADGVEAVVTTWAPMLEDVSGLIQTWELSCADHTVRPHTARWDGVGTLSRPNLTQLTEGGVLPPLDTTTTMDTEDGNIVITASEIPGVVMVAIDVEGIPQANHESIGVAVPDVGTVRLVVRVTIAETHHQSRATLDALAPDSLSTTVGFWEDRTTTAVSAVGEDRSGPLIPLVARAVTYGLGCSTVPVGGTRAVLTDHRILPLTWTRDAYWTCTALAETGVDPSGALVRGHLAWLFKTAERPDGHWARSYLPTGTVKDPAYQLDQQCYPLLEVIDHLDRTEDEGPLRRYASQISEVVDNLMGRRHPSGLLPTEETPADDPLDLPFHLSSNLLVAHTLSRLMVAADVIGWPSSELSAASTAILNGVDTHLVVEVGGQLCWGYATNLETTRWYHDANDVPTVLAPKWGLDVPRDLWRATLETAFSPANPAGYAAGKYGGLGSVHTPGAWPLGDAQEVMFAALEGDKDRAHTVFARLAATSSWDGSLPECRDPHTGAVRSRHWFTWPNCLLLLALRLLQDPRGGHW
ncbi:MAG: metal-independent alpha-mannosidase [Acidimicrobiia bacterium]|nr:metal-independent alpha-mannosidase [Acidimicrobiia bacterium]